MSENTFDDTNLFLWLDVRERGNCDYRLHILTIVLSSMLY